jgi:hypothetical protein
MDGRQFDDLLRTLTGTRRAAIASLLAAMSGLASLTVADAKKKRKKKRKKGCRGCPACTSCVKGKCRAVPDRTACGGECQECMGGQCVNKPADTVCSANGRCLAGICNARPTCQGFNIGGCQQLGEEICCSEVCDTSTSPTGGICTKASIGQQCKANTDCTSGACVGYRCQ